MIRTIDKAKPERSRNGLTLLELVVVLGILVILASLVVPNVGGLIFQSRHAGNAALVRDVNHAVNSYVARFGVQPNLWDSLIDTTSAQAFNKLHTQLQAADNSLPQLQVQSLTAAQAKSLLDVGINLLVDADNARSVQGRKQLRLSQR